jgi:glycosyltransferase involved in cell wall biosynthesis
VKLLLVTFYFPPAGGGGVQRPLKFATHLPALGVETHVLAPDDPRWIHVDAEQLPPTRAWVHRVRYVGPRGRRPAEELHGSRGLQRATRQLQLLGRRLLVPDENATFALTGVPAAVRLVREHGIDVVLTTSPPNSIHLIGAAVQAATGVRWVADLRDSLTANPHRRYESRAVRLKESGAAAVARAVARRADAIVTVSDAVAEEARALNPKGEVATIANGCDFDDFSGLEYRPSDRFRITHTGTFFGKRDPRPFLTALRESGIDALVRFVGGFRSADREWAKAQGLAHMIEVHDHVPRRRALELQRDSEVLLLLIPDAGGRGKGVLSGKVFEYLAAERPIIAAVPPEGEAAKLIRDTATGVVAAPDDVATLRVALEGLYARWQAGRLQGTPLSTEQRDRLSRRARTEELAELLWRVTS